MMGTVTLVASSLDVSNASAHSTLFLGIFLGCASDGGTTV